MIRVKEGEPRVKEGVHPDLSDKYGENPFGVKGVNLFFNIAPKKEKKGYIENKVSSSTVLPFTPFTLDGESAANSAFLGVHPLYKIKQTKPLEMTNFYRVDPPPSPPSPQKARS